MVCSEQKYIKVTLNEDDFATIENMINLLDNMLNTMNKYDLSTADTDSDAEYVTKEELEYFDKVLHKLWNVETLH